MTASTTEARYADNVQRLADRAEIAELTARYNRAMDDQDVDAFLTLFTRDAVMELVGAGAFQGHEQLSELLLGTGFGTVHVSGDITIEVTGDSAAQSSVVTVYRRQRDRQGVTLLMTGRYDDVLARTEEGWKFAKRTGNADVTLELVMQRLRASE